MRPGYAALGADTSIADPWSQSPPFKIILKGKGNNQQTRRAITRIKAKLGSGIIHFYWVVYCPLVTSGKSHYQQKSRKYEAQKR
jgi:hypothetical protein